MGLIYKAFVKSTTKNPKLLYILNYSFDNHDKRGVKMPGLELAEVILAVIIGTLLAIVYSLRVLILMERRIASMEANIQKMTNRVLKEEIKIERLVTKRKVSKKKRR